MKNIIFFEAEERDNLLPLTFTKPISELRFGGLTFNERWQFLIECKTSNLVQEKYLEAKYPLHIEKENLFINPCFFPTEILVEEIASLSNNQALFFEDKIIAFYGELENFNEKKFNAHKKSNAKIIHIQFPWDLFTHNFFAIDFDFQLLTKDKTSQTIPNSVTVIGDKNKIFIEENAQLYHCSLNTNSGVIYIGKNAEIMEGSTVRGSLFLGENSKINMGSKIYGGTTIGPNCKVGGEINNAVIMQYSNKGHEGFLGNSIIGEWCNIGADTNTSNMKNNYAEVKSWNYKEKKFIGTKLQFSGLIMGDHSKAAINTQFNTGTVCGVSANIFCNGFPPNLINHFSWGGNKDATRFKFEAAIEVAERMMQRRNITLTEQDISILRHIFDNH